MDKTTPAQYTFDKWKPVQQGYTLSYEDSTRKLKLVGPDRVVIFDVVITDVAKAVNMKTAQLFCITLKNGDNHYIGTSYKDGVEWRKLFKQQGVQTYAAWRNFTIWVVAIVSVCVVLAIIFT